MVVGVSTALGLVPARALLVMTVLLCLPLPGRSAHSYIRCGECDPSRCPELHYCEGQAIKDHCGCCTVCSSSKFQPHLSIAQQADGKACDQVQCPKLKVCVENLQGLPLCTCPTMFVCRRSKHKDVCGTDGNTYPSRCHMRVAACNQGVAVRKKHRGACTEDDEEKDGADYKRKVKKMKKRRRRRRRKEESENGTAEERRQKRKERKERKDRRRKRRKSGSRVGSTKSRMRRHRGKQQAGRAFEEAFGHYTWRA